MVLYQEIAQTENTIKNKPQEQLLAPYFLMRVPGLPFSTVEQLQFPHTDALVAELLQIESWQNEYNDALQEILREQLKQIEDKQVQHKGLDLRRAMTSNNGSKAQRLLQSIATYLQEDVVQKVAMWCQKSIKQAELLSNSEAILQEEMGKNRKILHTLFGDEAFQHGLLLSSQTLYTELQNYLSTPVEKNNNRVRRTEEGLLSYLIRMATKTSPYSTFCSTTQGTWHEPEEPATELQFQNWQQRRITRLSSPLFLMIAQTLSQHPEIQPHNYVSLNSTLHWISKHEETQNQWGKIEILVQEKIKERRFDYNERLARIQLNLITYTIIHSIESTSKILTYQQLLMQAIESVLQQVMPENGPESGQARPAQQWIEAKQQVTQKVTISLEHLIKHSVISLDLRIPAHEDDKLHCLLQRLAPLSGQWIEETRSELEHIHQLTRLYADASPAESARMLNEIRDQTIGVCRRIGAYQNPPWDPTDIINKFYPSLILEDSILPSAQPTLQRQTWEPVLADLRILHKLAPLFDFGIMMKMRMDRWASQALTEDEDFISCHLHFWQDFMPTLTQQQDETNDPQFMEFRRLQQAFMQQISDKVKQAQQENSKLVQLDPDEIQRFTQHFPNFIKQPATLAHFGQLFFDQQEPKMVLNATWAGPGVAFSRFSYPFTTTNDSDKREATVPEQNSTFAAQIQAYARKVGQRNNTTYASIAETGDINVNTHAQITPNEILFPFSAAQQPEEQQLSLRDLHATFDSSAQEFRIFSQRLKTTVSPLHLGFSLIQMMPPIYQTLVTTTEHYPKFDMTTVLEAQLPAEQKKLVRHYPRIVFGHIIINRECWKVPVTDIPQRESNENAFDYCLKLNRWRIAREIPRTCFRRIILDNETPFSQQPAKINESPNEQEPQPKIVDIQKRHRTSEQVNKTLRKPFYMDFQNCFLVSLFNTALKAFPAETMLTFEEVLPEPEQHLLHKGDQSYATECILELGN